MTGRAGRDCDVLVVGGGPAGLATALGAAHAGFTVLVAEPRSTPVDKACGEGLMPGGVRALERLGVPVSGRPFTGIRYVRGEHSALAAFRDGTGLGVRRTVLHQALHGAALSAGVRVLPLRVDPAGVCQDGAGVSAGGLRARWLVAADGLHSPLRRHLGLDAPPSRPGPAGGLARYGLRRHFAVPSGSEPDWVEVHWSDRSEAYVTPVAPGLLGVAVLTTCRGPFQERLAAFPQLAHWCAVPVTPVRGAGPMRQRARARVHGRVLLVGDAAGYVDALTGEGVALALRCAEDLVACLRRGEPQAYEAAWRRTTRRYRVLTHALLATRRHPLLARSLVPSAMRLPNVFAAAVNAL